MARPASKFANGDDDDLRALRRMRDEHPLKSHRRRAGAMVMSMRRYDAKTIARTIEAKPETVCRWIDRYNERGIDGLCDPPRPCGEPKLSEKNRQVLMDLLEEMPGRTAEILAELAQRTGVTISRTTFRRECRRRRLKWKRTRKSLKKKRNEKAFRSAKRTIARMLGHKRRRHFFFDEAAITLRGVVPYAWQPIGRRWEVPVSGASRPSLQVLGFEGTDGVVHSYLHRGTVNASVVADVFEHFSGELAGRSTVILDNASAHTSTGFIDQSRRWLSRGMRLFRLPPYCPELNRIECFWLKLKYRLLPITAYESFEDLLDCTTAALQTCGEVIHMPSLVES